MSSADRPFMFQLQWTEEAAATYRELELRAADAEAGRKTKGIKKSSKQEGLFKQVRKALELLGVNPKHPGLNTHAYESLANPYDPKGKVWEAYAQNNTPGAHRIFWCYGPGKHEITVIAITPHP